MAMGGAERRAWVVEYCLAAYAGWEWKCAFNCAFLLR
jgi:hypothetical protein